MTMSSIAEPAVSERAVAETATEKQLIEIIEEVLDTEGIGLHDRFTKIGGNSLNLITVIKKIKEDMGITLKSRLFFHPKTSTIFKLSQEIDAARDSDAENS